MSEALQIVWFTETFTQSFLMPREELWKEHLQITIRTGLMEDIWKGLWTDLINKLLTNL